MISRDVVKSDVLFFFFVLGVGFGVNSPFDLGTLFIRLETLLGKFNKFVIKLPCKGLESDAVFDIPKLFVDFQKCLAVLWKAAITFFSNLGQGPVFSQAVLLLFRVPKFVYFDCQYGDLIDQLSDRDGDGDYTSSFC